MRIINYRYVMTTYARHWEETEMHISRERRTIPCGRRLWTVKNKRAKVNTEIFQQSLCFQLHIQTLLLVRTISQLHQDHPCQKTSGCAKDYLLACVTEVRTFDSNKKQHTSSERLKHSVNFASNSLCFFLSRSESGKPTWNIYMKLSANTIKTTLLIRMFSLLSENIFIAEEEKTDNSRYIWLAIPIDADTYN